MLTNDWLDWNHIQEIVTKGDIQDWNCSDVHHWVKVADLANAGQTKEVLVVEARHLARELTFELLTRISDVPVTWLITEVLKSGKGKKGKCGLNYQERSSNNIAIEKHAFHCCLWSHRINNAGNGMMINEHKGSVSKHFGKVLELVLQVENWGLVHAC